MKFCTNCGEQNPDEAKFCKGCGKPFNADVTSSVNEVSATSSDAPPTRASLLEMIASMSSHDARALIEKYIISTSAYQSLELDLIKAVNRNPIYARQNKEEQITKSIKDLKGHLVDRFVIDNNLERRIFINSSVLALKLWSVQFPITIGKNPKLFIDILSTL